MSAPLDPDLIERPAHLRFPLLALVAAGGMIGTATRELLVLAMPGPAVFPTAVLVANLVGAFVLGLLLEALARCGPDTGRRRLVRLGLGTGFCGGLTTFSSMAAAIAVASSAGAVTAGALYGLVTVLVGALATWAGIALGARVTR